MHHAGHGAKSARIAVGDEIRIEADRIAARRGKPERFGEILRQHEEVALGVEILGAFSAALGVIAGAAWVGATWSFSPEESIVELLGTSAVVGLVLVIVRTWAPWAGARLFAEGFLYRTWWLWRAVAAITLTGAPSANARRMIPGDDSPPAADRSSHCAAITAARNVPGAASDSGTPSRCMAIPPTIAKKMSAQATIERSGAAIGSGSQRVPL